MIDVSLDQLVPTLLAHLDETLISRVLDDIADGARAQWIWLARRRLNTGKDDYIRGIQPVEVQEGARIISLVGWLPNAIETGLNAFDLRKTLLSGRSRLTRTAADGHRYGHVPFRHSIPSGRGRAGTPMGAAYGERGASSRRATPGMEAGAAKALGKQVYGAAKKLKATTLSRNRGVTRWGGRLAAGKAPLLAPHHKTDVFAGMVRVRHKYEKAKQTQYMTFRTISTRNPEGWMHPGITARNLAGDVEGWIRKHASAIVKSAMQAAMGEGQ